MLAGAYSKTYQALEQQQVEHLKLLADDEKGDAVAKAKKLSLETNKRRKAQATKRKVEQEREEKRRQLILTKRREQQREATEKYQRSHLPARPPSGRNSGANSPTRGHNKSGRGLDETLRLIRGHSGHHHGHQQGHHTVHHHRHRHGNSTHSGQASPRQSYSDALNRPYFNKYSSHRPNSPPEKSDMQAKNRLHNNSLRNLTNSKSLFEQQLEQQQRLLADQQKQAISDFNSAVLKEIMHEKSGFDASNIGVGEENNYVQCDTDSLSSEDSLERSQNFDGNYGNDQGDSNYGNGRQDIIHVDHRDPGDSVPRTNTSSILTRDTHQNVRDISAQLNSNGGYYPPAYPTNDMGQIDSYNVDQTQNMSQNPVTRGETKQDFQSMYQTANKANENRPKVQLRAWATPSPVDSAHVARPVVVPMTNSNPYTPRNTMTTVTLTTVYDENKLRSQQSNGWSEEKANLQNQYSGIVGNVNDVHNGMCDNTGLSSKMNSHMEDRNEQQNGTRNLEFLETVTNTLDKKESSLAAKPPMGSNSVSITKTQVIASNVQTAKPPPASISKLPRPVSAKGTSPQNPQSTENVNVMNTGNLSPTSKAHASSFANTVPIPPGSPRSFNTYNSGQKTMGVVKTQTSANGTNGGGAISGEENQKVFVNLGGAEKPQVRQVTNVKFAASVVNGNVHMNNYGKLQVLPDKPVIVPQHVPEKASESKNVPVRKASDDSDLGREKPSFNGIDTLEVKGILKRPGRMRTLKKAGSTGTVHNGFDVKDSIEIAKANMETHHVHKKIPKKKSVRFADLRYSDDMEGEEEEGEQNTTTATAHKHRPVSAKVTSQTKVDSRVPRSASAGAHRVSAPPKQHKSSIVRPQAAAHIITQSPAASAILTNSYSESNENKVTFTTNNFMSKVPVTTTLKSSSITPAVTEVTVYSVPGVKMNYVANMTTPTKGVKTEDKVMNGETNPPVSSAYAPQYHNGVNENTNNAQGGPVYNENGMRIDRTPTDDEINYLWEKVRTCLNRNSTQGPPVSEPVKVTQVTTEPAPRQAAPVSNKYIDGAALSQMGQKSRVTVYNHQNLVQAYRNNQTGGDYKPAQIMDQAGAYQKRFGLLQQRKQQQNPNSLNKNGLQRQTITYHGPVFSNQEPSQNNMVYQPPPEASESMAAFLTAEHLAQQSMSDSQIQEAMEEAQRQQLALQAGRPPAQKVPSALSVEEQRLLESLDRLNEKLKITEFPGALLQEAGQVQPEPVPPQPYVYGGAFKGHQPINSQRRLSEVSRGGGFRVASANRGQNFRYS